MPRQQPLPRPQVTFPPLRLSAGAASVAGVPAMHGIYRLLCVPMRMAYVGQAFDLAHRCLEHQLELRDGIHTNSRLQGAYDKFGPRAFVFEVLELWTGPWRPDCLSPAEQRWMDAHGRSRLYNVRRAGSDAYQRGLEIGGKPSSQGESTAPHADNRPLGRSRSPHDTADKDWRKQTGNWVGKNPKRKPR